MSLAESDDFPLESPLFPPERRRLPPEGGGTSADRSRLSHVTRVTGGLSRWDRVDIAARSLWDGSRSAARCPWDAERPVPGDATASRYAVRSLPFQVDSLPPT